MSGRPKLVARGKRMRLAPRTLLAERKLLADAGPRALPSDVTRESEPTDEDRKRIAAAELKRARKNARRLGLVRSEEADDSAPVKYKRATPDAELYASVHHEDDGSFSWEVVSYTDGGCERNSHARSATSTLFIEEAELAALRAAAKTITAESES